MIPKSLSHIVGHVNYFAKFSTCILLIFLSFNMFSQTKAFPSVIGAGSHVTGGRGGVLVEVTNLNDSGPGSLREALMMTVPRTIVFEVSGTIVLNSRIELILENSNFTIAGQTAPEGGITISNDYLRIGGGYNRPSEACNNVIIRYVRFRNGRYNGLPDQEKHNGIITTGCNGLVIDHCSFSFCDDQAITMGGYYGDLRNITVQSCVFSENATAIIAGGNGQFQQGNMTFVNNLFVDQGHRTPNIGGGLQYDVINNVYYNWKSRLINVTYNNPDINYIGNYLREGAYTNVGHTNQRQNGTPQIYTANNYHSSYYTTPQLDDRNLWQRFVNDGAVPDYMFTTTMHPLIQNPTILEPEEAYDYVLSNVGTNKYLNSDGSFGEYRDSFDVLKIGNVQNNISTDPFNKNWTLPTLPNNSRPNNYDSDNDGMSDEWEINNFNTLSHDGSAINTATGYTELEDFLNGVDAQDTAGSQVTVSSDNDTICQGQEVVLTASGADSYSWDNNGETSPSITVTPDVTTTYTVTGTHSDGNITEAEITITVNETPTANAGQDIETCQGIAVTLTASGGTSYEWNNGETTASITVNPNATETFSVMVTNDENCSSTDEVIVTVNESPNVDAGEDQTIFIGESATLIATGADTYLWSTGETTPTITVNPTLDTSYSVTGTSNNCEQTDTVTVFLLDDSVLANAGEDIEICQGETTTLTATGGATYLWNTGDTTASIDVTPTDVTTYTVTAFSPSGNNQEDASVTVTVNDIPIADAGQDTEICFGNSTTLTASGGTSYLWNTGETTQSITVNPSDTTNYTVEVFENNCSSTDDVNVIVNPLPSVDAGNDVSIIEGESTILTASGADTYIWNTGETTESITINPIITTTYSVVGSLNGCEATDEVIVTILSETVDANAGDDIEICQGESVTLTATGGASFLWNTGETTASIDVTPTASATYTVTVFSPSGNNQEDASVTVTVNDNPIADAGEDTEICSGNPTTLTASGGSTFLWNTGETTQSITVIPGETTVYTVEVFENNCSSTDDVIVVVNPLPSIDAGIDVDIMEGESATLTATGADTYLWSTGETTASIIVSPDTTKTYTVTGFLNGCEATDEVTVVLLTENVTADIGGGDFTICNGITTTLSATGGATYLWSTGATTSSITISPTETTTYTVTAFSPSGTNQDEDSVTVTVINISDADAGEDTEICLGNSVTLTASGGSSYLWSTGETTQSITVSPDVTNIYSVEIFENNCSSTDDVQVIVNEAPNVDAGNDVSINEGESTTLTATGADTYLWSTGETTTNITVNPNNTTSYSVTGFLNGCEASDEVIVIVLNENVNASAGTDVAICQGETITLTAMGGATYLWSTGEITASIQVAPNVTTNYTVTAFSPSGENQDDDSVIVTVNDIPIADAGNDIEICFGNATTLTASGGSSYLWSTGETTQNITVNPNETTIYSVEVFENNCSSTDDVLVTVNTLPSTNAGSDVTINEGETTTLTATGADTYLWSTGETTANITVNPNNTTSYSVTGFSNDCEASDEIVVTVVPFDFEASAGANREICQGYQTTLTASEGDSYLWSTGETTQSITVNPTNTQTYTVTVYQGDFQDDADVTVSVTENPNVVIVNGGDVTILEGEFITLSASGANTYLWNNSATQPNIAVSPATTTIFEVTGYINNCEDTKAVQVNVVELVQADAGEDMFICNNETVTLTANGGDDYLWNTGETTQSIEVSPDEDTEYSVLVYNALDSDEASVRVFVEQCDVVEIPSESEDFGFIVYQDPISDILKVKINGMSNVTVKGISIYDITGKAIYSEQFDVTELENQSEMVKGINTSLYARGIYMVKLNYDDTNAIKKVPIR